jgi:hypothetical protein
MRRPRRTDAPAVVVGLAAVTYAGFSGGPGTRLLALPAALAVLAATLWPTAATLAGCLLVTSVAVGEAAAPTSFTPAGLALIAALLTLYLVLVDATGISASGWLVPAASVALAIAAVTVASLLPARTWMTPLGMAAAATALILAVATLRARRPDEPADDPPAREAAG